MSEIVRSEPTFEPQSRTRVIPDAITAIPEFPSVRATSLDWEFPLRVLAKSYVAPGTRSVITAFVILTIFATCGMTVLLGLPQMAVYGHDTFNFLDGGWRVLQGQIPHVDFYSALGPVYYFLWAAGFKMAHGRVEGIVYATAMAGVVLGIWAFAVARKRFGALCATFCTVFLICFWLAPFAIGDPFYLTTYGMQYNRLGYVLFFIIFIELFGVADQNRGQGLEWGGLSSGLALSGLLFLKANFFIVALVPIAFVYLFRIKGTRHALFLLCGFFAVLVPMSGYLHWHLGSFLADLRIAGAARAAQKNTLLKALIFIPSRNLATILVVSGLSLLAQSRPGGEGKKAFPSLKRSLVWLLLVLGCDFVLASSNMQGSGLPLSLIAILLLADQLIRQGGLQELEVQRALAMCLFVVLTATVLPQISDLANAWAVEYTSFKWPGTRGSHIDAPPIAALGFKDHSDAVWGRTWDNGRLLTDRTNDGLALLRRNTSANERIACLCSANPFGYALMRDSPHGGSPFFDYGYNFNESSAPTAERIVGDADVVMYPKEEGDSPTIATLRRICEPVLSKNFRIVAESEQWVLLRRNG